MANIKSKMTRIKTNEKARVRNAAIKSRVRTAIKNAKAAIVAKEANAQINTAVSKGVFHKNNGARKSSRLDAFFNKNK
ncbi:30S ribosomal protein S20 [Mycoplasma todarodis]|uniref:Small ribosomal subunit protein bS20 n=1 Tax=Mycoplasma todarodis TaxID=1937191 RepID=A0A4R0XK40_9MOLU|nr:30S ribosomal protein S20 [Mycoplasma todarodis]TCG11003.1 30S ribosomal protein S20 [Mycoplasma todarodis]